MMTALELIVLFFLPALIVRLTKKSAFFGKVGAIALCYFIGFILSLLPLGYDKDLAQTAASVLVALAIPLVLFSMDVTAVKKLAKKTTLAFGLQIVTVLLVSSLCAAVGVRKGLDEAPELAGMATGLYVGGTPNMFAIGSALLRDLNAVNLANISDSLLGGVYFLLLVSVLPKLYRLVLDKGRKERPSSGAGSGAHDPAGEVQGEYDYSVIPRDKKGLFRLLEVILLAAACLLFGVRLEVVVNGNMDGSLYIMITVSVLGILLSLLRSVREVKGSYQVGQYLILVFSLGLSMSIDFGKLLSGILPTFLFFTAVMCLSVLVHLLLCRLFRIDGGTAIITSTAGLYGPPFIAPVANAFGDRSLIVPGVICGTLGLVIGNLLGIGLGSLLAAIL